MPLLSNGEPRLSEKAKGKQRAEPLQANTFAPSSSSTATYSPNLHFKIRFVDGAPDMVLEIPSTRRAGALKELVSACHSLPTRKSEENA